MSMDHGAKTLAEIAKGFDARSPMRSESTYRRGYHQGYDTALGNLISMVNDGKSFDEIIGIMAKFADGELRDWRSLSREGFETPPSLTLGEDS